MSQLQPEFPAGPSDHWISTERGTLFARAWGTSVPTDDGDATILLFHDSLGCVELWRDFPAQLATATGRRVVAYDRLGFGQSDAVSGKLPYTFVHDEGAWAVPLLRSALGLRTLILFGHSVGGGMAVATAARFNDASVALVTESAQSFVEARTLDGVRAARTAFREAGQLERLARYHGDKARRVLDAWTETWLDPAYADWVLDEELRRVRCPTLALHGDADEFGSVQHPARIASLVGGPSCAVILEGCGHVPHREQPQRVLDEVSRFLASLHARPNALPDAPPPRRTT
ncbi:MAG TPA: alpha/beta hydrolase [Gemmatimonadaceae bacterium]|nr:alpha/beta hydrolase [Gemmatimonadaceae bacterium]